LGLPRLVNLGFVQMTEDDKESHALEKSGVLQRESAQEIHPVDYVQAVTEPLKFITVLGVIAGLAFAAMGVWLVIGSGESGESEIKFLGQEIKTTSVGVASIFIGATTAIMTIRRVLKSFDIVLGKKK
jgi:uncharacterized membrane protein